MSDEFTTQGADTVAKVSATDDGKTKVEIEVDSYADALAAADHLTRARQGGLSGLDRVNAMDAHISPRLRQTGEITFKAIGIAFGVVLGLVVALSSGDAAMLIFPDAPMPMFLLWAFGALTVPGGIWAADELMKLLKDDVKDQEQRVRITAFSAVVVCVLLFDSLGVLTARIAHTSGAMTLISRNSGEAATLEANIARARTQIAMAEVPTVSSAVLASRVEAEKMAPTRTGRPVNTVGELMALCKESSESYCLPYQNRFARIAYLQSELQSAIDAENVVPELQRNIAVWEGKLRNLQTSGEGDIDKLFCRNSDANADCMKDSRFFRTAIISIGQVIILAIVWLLILEDRHKQILVRKKGKLESMRAV